MTSRCFDTFPFRPKKLNPRLEGLAAYESEVTDVMLPDGKWRGDAPSRSAKHAAEETEDLRLKVDAVLVSTSLINSCPNKTAQMRVGTLRWHDHLVAATSVWESGVFDVLLTAMRAEPPQIHDTRSALTGTSAQSMFVTLFWTHRSSDMFSMLRVLSLI